MDEDDGKASALPGITVASEDEEIQRLESILRDGIKPRIPRVEFGAVPLKNSKLALVIRIPQSWAAPHIITLKNLSQFWARNSNGKYQLDVDEIRAAFRISDGLAEAIKNFRIKRIAILWQMKLP